MDVWELSWHTFRLPRRGDCPCCAGREFPYLEVAATTHATSLCGRNAVQITVTRPVRLDLAALGERLRGVGEVSVNAYLLKLQAGDHRLTLFRDARAIVEGTTDEALARSLYARYVGV